MDLVRNKWVFLMLIRTWSLLFLCALNWVCSFVFTSGIYSELGTVFHLILQGKFLFPSHMEQYYTINFKPDRYELRWYEKMVVIMDKVCFGSELGCSYLMVGQSKFYVIWRGRGPHTRLPLRMKNKYLWYS